MSNVPNMCTPGYPAFGGVGALTAECKSMTQAARVRQQWARHGRNVDVVRVQTLIATDVPGGSLSALSFVRRP